ncbi:MAG: 8-oxo-dGTP diphosphatase [Candidatus Micrarchaeota archaeon]
MNVQLRKVTLSFIIKGNEILLAMKKRGFGAGLWNGYGGKLKDGESIYDAAKREVKEEIDIDVKSMKKVGVLDFYFEGDKPDWNQQVHVFLIQEYNGEPKESEEMLPKWFKINEIPYDKMWEDDKFWLPRVIEGHSVYGRFVFGADNKLKEKHVELDPKKIVS